MGMPHLALAAKTSALQPQHWLRDVAVNAQLTQVGFFHVKAIR